MWANLRGREKADDTICAYLDSHMPQIITYDPLPLVGDDYNKTRGFFRNSEFHLNIALMASASAIYTGVLQIDLRKSRTGDSLSLSSTF